MIRVAKVLFVGGFADGKWIEVPYEEFGELPGMWVVTHRPKIEYKHFDANMTTIESPPMTREIYKRTNWNAGTCIRFIYAHESLSHETVLNLLIYNYKP